MKIIKYICDKCGRETDHSYQLRPQIVNSKGAVSLSSAFAGICQKDLCENCIKQIAGWLDLKDDSDEPEEEEELPELDLAEADPDFEPEPPEIDQETEEPEEAQEPAEYKPKQGRPKHRYDPNERKAWYLTKDMKEEITERYRAGEEMEDIAVAMNAGLPPVSKFIQESGLAKERYGS